MDECDIVDDEEVGAGKADRDHDEASRNWARQHDGK